MGKEFWLSESAAGYPDAIVLPNGAVNILKDGIKQRQLVGTYLQRQQMIPKSGAIIDIGAGSCSAMILGEKVARTRTYAVDASAVLLSRNPVPDDRKLIIDVGQDEFPYTWHGSFRVAVSTFLHRYLTYDQSLHLAKQVRSLLEPDGRYIILDQRSIPNPALGVVMGEEREFDASVEADILQTAGFRVTRADSVPIYDLGLRPFQFTLGQVVGIP